MSLDLNDAPPQGEPVPLFPPERIKGLSQRLGECADHWVPTLFPRGRISADRKELRMANTFGDPPRNNGSCVVWLRGEFAGHYRDFSTQEFGDALDTLRLATGLAGQELYEHAEEIVGGGPRLKVNGRDPRRDADKADQSAAKIKHILSKCEPAAGTLVESYLNSRGLDLPACQDVLFHPDLTDYSQNIGRPGMVVHLRHPGTLQFVQSIHRTYLADDGRGKADTNKPKMLLGSPAGGVAMLAPMREDGVLGIAEGIETALAAMQIFGIPVWAGISDSGLRNFSLQPGLKHLAIFADKGAAGEAAAWGLYDRAVAAGTQAVVVLPHSDDDFAKDIETGVVGGPDSYVPYVRSGGSIVSFYDLAATPAAPSGAVAAPPGLARGLDLIHFRDMRPRLEYRGLVEGLLVSGELSAVVGASGTGKTFLAIDLALHVAGGRPWFGRSTQQMGVIYIAAEAGRGIENRVAAYKTHYPDIPNDLPFAAIVSPVDLSQKISMSGLVGVLDAIENAGLGLPVGLIIVDTLSRSMGGGDENSSEDMGKFIANMDELRSCAGAHVLIVHHFGKDASRGARGHSSFHAALDTEIIVERDNATGISTATVTKQRDLPTAGRITYALRSVELGRDQDGRPVTSCIVEPADAEAANAGKPKPRLALAVERAFDLLVDAVARNGQIPPPNDHLPPEKPCVRESYWRQCCYDGQISDGDTQDAKRRAFTRAAEKLVETGLAGKWGEWVWPIL